MMTTKQAADALGITPRRVRWLIQHNHLAAQQINPRMWLLREPDVRAFSERRRHAGRPPVAAPPTR